ncbi:hypothetical protein ACL58G_17200 [Massilia sp. GER05]|uniref:hypothetical protein n=1 Tax=unclassified Massilia TaxID=2609279 RepID=UPI0039AE9F55
MKKRLFFSLIALACVGCHADGLPIVGIVEQIPVLANGSHVTARPTYIFTDEKLSGSTVFNGLQGPGSTLDVVCCYEVKNTTPTSLDTELAKYGKDPLFASQMKSIKGYRYIYVAAPTSDKKLWTPVMKTLAQIAANPEDGSPFSAAVVGARFDKPTILASFTANGVPMTMQTRSDTTSGRIIYTFTRGGKKVEMSEDTFAD